LKRSVSLLGLLIALPLFVTTTFGQSTPLAQADALRSVVRLPPGYTSQAQDGVDTGTEQIWNKDGFKFNFVWDMYSGGVDNIVGKRKVRWRGAQIINGHKAIFAYAESDRLVVCFPEDQSTSPEIFMENRDLA
jgi:hypothetical protein